MVFFWQQLVGSLFLGLSLVCLKGHSLAVVLLRVVCLALRASAANPDEVWDPSVSFSTWNLHRSINFCLPPCSIPKLTRRSTFCLPFASERFLTIRAEIPFGRVFFFPMVKLPPKRAQKCAKTVQNERKSAQTSANERKFKKCYESQVANCICADVSSTFC